MKCTILQASSTAIILCLLAVSALASGPGMISYQGILKDSGGEPVNGNVTIIFAIYNAAEDGSILWQETHTDVAVSNGELTAILGQGTPPVAIDDTVFASSDRWLGITIGADPEIVPRTRLVSVPYSHRVSTVEGAEAGELNGTLEIGPSSKDGDRYESGIIVTGSYGDSVIICPADDIIIRGTTDDGDEAVFMGTATNGGVSTGVVEISSTDAAKAGSRKVLINPGDSILLQGVDGDGDIAVNVTMNEYGGALQISSTDAAKFDPDAVTSSVFIAPADNIALQAEDLSGDTLINLSTSGSEGSITLKSNAGTGLSRVEIGDDGIYFFDDTRGDTTMILHADGSVTGKGQISMGQQHADLADWSNVLGYDNEATGDSSVVSGGYDNVASGRTSTVSGGFSNLASGRQSTVSGGVHNSATENSTTVGGGAWNTADGYGSLVAGGTSNYAGSFWSTVVGGIRDSAYADYSVIVGGEENNIYPEYCFIGGGFQNRIDSTSDYSFIGGGYQNNILDGASRATIAGGDQNRCARWCFIGGGYCDTALTWYGVICGGKLNFVNGSYDVIVGGEENRSDGPYNWNNFIGGGKLNHLEGATFSSIPGGNGNHVDGASSSSIVGGAGSYCAGSNSTILGGSSDTLGSSADYSMTFGSRVYLNNSYRVALFSGDWDGKLGINRDDNTGGISYPIHVGTSTSNGNGAYLSAGGTWTNGSSREFKDRFMSLDGDDLLARVRALPVRSWYYKGTGEKHIGPVAEDFVAAFDVGVTSDDGARDDKYLATGDVAGVALAAVKELMRKLEEKSEEIEALKSRIAELEKAMK